MRKHDASITDATDALLAASGYPTPGAAPGGTPCGASSDNYQSMLLKAAKAHLRQSQLLLGTGLMCGVVALAAVLKIVWTAVHVQLPMTGLLMLIPLPVIIGLYFCIWWGIERARQSEFAELHACQDRLHELELAELLVKTVEDAQDRNEVTSVLEAVRRRKAASSADRGDEPGWHKAAILLHGRDAVQP